MVGHVGSVQGAGIGAEFAGDYSQIFEWVSQLLKGPEGREKALLELSRKREQYDDLALILWHSFGIHPCPVVNPLKDILKSEFLIFYAILTPPLAFFGVFFPESVMFLYLVSSG